MKGPSPSSVRSNAHVLFVSSNGVGMGHLTRLLAVARRLPEGFDAVFLTMSQALSVIHQFGFHAEYIPSHQQSLSDPAAWNSWLACEVDQIIEEYAIHSVVFDGNLVFPGIIDAVSQRPEIPLIWIRRGMWRSDQDNSPSLHSGEKANLIIEPDDIASAFDVGLSAERRDEVVVDPIRLLDSDEVLPREESCRTLGLDPDHRHVLIQLGAGNNSNIVDLIGSVVATLEETGVASPVIAEWLTSDFRLDLWPEVPRLSCYPISRYLEAFDFSVSAAGYNSFNEIIGFGVASVLVPNLNRSMDNQAARAAFAHEHGAAVHLELEDYSKLDEALDALMDSGRRKSLKEKCRLIAKPNGASDAARIIAAKTMEGLGP